MTTTLVNTDFVQEIHAFLRPKSPVTPLAILYAFADCVKTRGPAWLTSPEAKAFLHSLNMLIHGRDYKLDSRKEQAWLESILR